MADSDFDWLSTPYGLKTADFFRNQILDRCTPATQIPPLPDGQQRDLHFGWMAPEGRLCSVDLRSRNRTVVVSLDWGQDHSDEDPYDPSRVHHYSDRITTGPGKPLEFVKEKAVSRFHPDLTGEEIDELMDKTPVEELAWSIDYPSSAEELLQYALETCRVVGTISGLDELSSAFDPDMAQKCGWTTAAALAGGKTFGDLGVEALGTVLATDPLPRSEAPARPATGRFRPLPPGELGRY